MFIIINKTIKIMRFYKTATNELGQDLFYQVVSENETQVNTLEFIIDTSRLDDSYMIISKKQVNTNNLLNWEEISNEEFNSKIENTLVLINSYNKKKIELPELTEVFKKHIETLNLNTVFVKRMPTERMNIFLLHTHIYINTINMFEYRYRQYTERYTCEEPIVVKDFRPHSNKSINTEYVATDIDTIKEMFNKYIPEF